MNQNFAVIGCGAISKKHFDSILSAGGNIIAICDNNETKLKEAFDYINPKIKGIIHPFIDHRTMLDGIPEITTVAVCTPHGEHYRIGEYVLSSGRNLVIEKPMCITEKQCEELFKTAAYNNVQLYPVLQNRYIPEVTLLKYLLEKETIRHINLSMIWSRPVSYYQNGWRGTYKHQDSVLMNQLLHYIDAMLYIIKTYEHDDIIIKDLYSTKHKDIEMFDTISMRMENYFPKFSINVFGTTAAPEKNVETKLTVITDKKTHIINFDEVAGKRNDYGTYIGSASKHEYMYKDIVTNGNVCYNVEDAKKIVKFIEQIHRGLGVNYV